MDTAEVIDVFREGIGVAIRISAPILLLCMFVGVFVALLQAVTQIHEQTIGLVLKMIVVVLVLAIGGGWMMEMLQEFTISIFQRLV